MLMRRPFLGLREGSGFSLSSRSMSAWRPRGADTLGLPKGDAEVASLASDNLMHASQVLNQGPTPPPQLTAQGNPSRISQPSLVDTSGRDCMAAGLSVTIQGW